MKKLETIIQKNHPVQVAGRIWIFKKVIYTKDLDDNIGISFEELDRIHRAVTNAICASDFPLSRDEFEFLCELTHTSSKDVSVLLGCSLPTISKWKKLKRIPKLESLVLKESFWLKLFGAKVVHSKQRPLLPFGTARLKSFGETAIENGLAEFVTQTAA